jgi:hypothetical protein
VEIQATSGSPAMLLVGWIDRNTGAGSGSSVRFSTASVDDPTPTWTHTLVDTDGALGVSNPNLSARTTAGGALRVSMAWDRGDDVMYATSADGGSTWTPPLEVYDAWAMLDLDLVVDELGVVHVVYTTFNTISDLGSLRYGRAVSYGEAAGDWEPAVELAVGPEDRFFNRAAIAADPDGQGVVAAGWVYVDLHVVTSDDNGDTWSASTTWTGLTYPEAAWGASGPVIAAGASDDLLTRRILQPESDLGGPWTSETLVSYIGFGTMSNSDMALDPSRGGLPMMVFMQDAYATFDEAGGQDLWFAAAWRDAPGYGVPEPRDPIRAETGPFVRAPLPADLDGDGTVEIVFTEATSDTVHTIRWRGAADEADDFSATDLHDSADIALVDLDGDGDREVFYFQPDATIMGRHGDGSVVDGFPMDLGPGTSAGWLSGGPVTGAAGEDLVVALGPDVWVLGPGGTPRPGFPFEAPGVAGPASGRVAIGDVDGDGAVELVAPFSSGAVIIDRDGQVVAPLIQGAPTPRSPSLADLDDDGDLEIAIPRDDGTIELLHHDGTSFGPAWPYDTGATGTPTQVALADVAGNARRDVVVMAHDRTVHLVTPAGITPPGSAFSVDPLGEKNDPVAGVLGTGGVSVAVGGADGVMQVREGAIAQDGWPRDLATAVTGPATATDVDGDGQTDLIIPTADALWILAMGVESSATARTWAISGADVGRTGCAEPFPGATSVEDAVPASPLVLAAAPNPFNPQTVLRFHLATDATDVSLRIFDPRGRLVRTLHEGPLAAGEHGIPWLGRSDDGRAMASGVYFCRLEADRLRTVRSVVLVR